MIRALAPERAIRAAHTDILVSFEISLSFLVKFIVIISIMIYDDY